MIFFIQSMMELEDKVLFFEWWVGVKWDEGKNIWDYF